MDKKPIEIDAVKEMEETQEIPTDHDKSRIRSSSSTPDMDQDEPMAIGDETTSAFCYEPKLVQDARISVPA